MSEAAGGTAAMAAWMVALAMAAGVGGVTFGVAARRRAREVEARLRSLERAVGDFYSALRARLELERERVGSGNGRESRVGIRE